MLAVLLAAAWLAGCHMGPRGPFCQSCAMPMDKPELFGTEAGGARSADYCTYCYQNGKFTEPSPSQEHLLDFRELSSPLSAMISEHCDLGDSPECWAPIDALYELHRAFYEAEGLTPMGSALFKSRVKTVIPRLERTRKMVAGEQVYVYKGIRIKRSAERKYLGRP